MAMEICISARTGMMLPCIANDQNKKNLFLKDNAHINSDIMHKGTAYISRSDSSYASSAPVPQNMQQMLKQLQALPPQNRQTISDLNAAYGSDLLLSLSSFYNNEILPLPAQGADYARNTAFPVIKKESIGFTGAGLTAVSERSTIFAKLITEYQKTLETLHAAYKNKLPKFQLMKLEAIADQANKTLNQQFQAELRRYMPMGKGSKGSIWSNAQRGMGLARGARTDAPLKLNNTNEIAKLGRFSKNVKFGGNGLLFLDAGFRGLDVYSDYNEGKDWQRSLVTQTAGFGFAGAGGLYMGQVATAAATVFLASTPFGWVIVIGVGLAVGYGVAKVGDEFGKNFAGYVYDKSSNFRWFD
jgi:TM2 domain-containing membrane protein YozV